MPSMRLIAPVGRATVDAKRARRYDTAGADPDGPSTFPAMEAAPIGAQDTGVK
jgi:hypothetical protein